MGEKKSVCQSINQFGSVRPSQSTFLISRNFFNDFPALRNLKGRRLRGLLHKLLSDPTLDQKLSLLRNNKVKKVYQATGQDLVPVFFYPLDSDWALLSALSNGSGFSRCYIFIFLLLFELGIRKLEKNRTIGKNAVPYKETIPLYRIFISVDHKKLLREIKTGPPE